MMNRSAHTLALQWNAEMQNIQSPILIPLDNSKSMTQYKHMALWSF